MTKLQQRAQWREVMAALRGHARVPDAAQILFGGTPQAQIQNRENNPMQSRMSLGAQPSGRLRPGHEMVRRHGPT
ncbi:hypothetical protein [Bradyrhizobium sp. 170]|uniref:hypothetical protein n=1 Tax=Bradyrhizobium sp. 170 TaxID=2782641 RepID=UPI001FFE6E36|nr:hypothetical protein [Bradyrhizobium sp. 170]UPK03247.1 hypothetical protein IVB05_37895 [Bradyrhizobium sp. 170]